MATQTHPNINIVQIQQNLNHKPVLSTNINENIDKLLKPKQSYIQNQFHLCQPPTLNTQINTPFNQEFQGTIGYQINEILNVEIKQTKNGLTQKYRKMIKNLKMKQSSQLCSICIMGFVKDEIIKKLPCGHILHRNCIKPWLKIDSRCPVCRYDLQNHYINEQMKKSN